MATNSYTLSVAAGYSALDVYVINEPPDGTPTLRVNIDNVVHAAGGVVGQAFDLSHLLPTEASNSLLRAAFQPTSALVRYISDRTASSMTAPHEGGTLQGLFESHFPGKTIRLDLFPEYFSERAVPGGSVFDVCSTTSSLNTLREYLTSLNWLDSNGVWLSKANNWETGRVNLLVNHSTTTDEGVVTFTFVICYHFR